MNKNRLRVTVAAALIALLAVTLYIFVRPVARVAIIKRGRAVNGIPGSVTVQAERDIDIKSEYAGRIIQTSLDRGRVVRQGDVLAKLDTTELELEIERIKSDLEAQKKRLEIGLPVAFDVEGAAEALAKRQRDFDQGVIAKEIVTQAERLLKQLEQKYKLELVENEQKLRNLENTLATKQVQLKGMTIIAPFDGMVADPKAQPGEIIGANMPIARFIMSTRVVQAKISEENIADVRAGQAATVRFLSYGDEKYPAKVLMVSPTADPATQRYVVDLDVQIDPERLKPGITGEVSIHAGVHDNVLIAPRRAVFGESLYAVNNGRVELRKVKPDYTALNEVELVSGVKEGDLVIVEQLDRYRPGDRVRTEVVN
ncbi:MAG: hypothetical protein A3G75_13610 [Verrucomicrobia bacterium RIFCSPLOWO2_12_FULL_64_8]|nr:MAG: hypothetical protein A3G75_13610 [Verrucomicrobia bacterium RIFCSPLOWO2_12_FULL_64_8]